jgi:hypothetical protein
MRLRDETAGRFYSLGRKTRQRSNPAAQLRVVELVPKIVES